MKKRIETWLIFMVFFLVGCRQEIEIEENFSLTTEEQSSYIVQIDALLDEYYWNYDTESLIFVSGNLPEYQVETEIMFLASQVVDLDMKPYTGRKGVVVTANLYHYNDDVAGLAYFWFVEHELVGAYYEGGYDNGLYNLKERNPFLGDGSFSNYESDASMREWETQIIAEFDINTILTQGYNWEEDMVFVGLVDNTIQWFKQQNNTIKHTQTTKFEENAEVIGATFLPIYGEELLAVLTSSIEEYTIIDDEQMEQTISTLVDTIYFYNHNFELVNAFSPEGNGYTCISADGNSLLLFAGKSMEFYRIEGESDWHLNQRALLKNNIIECHVVDMDGNGIKEYLMTDGSDLYMYQYEEMSLKKIWSTHLGVESLYGTIATGDLNGDGVKEIYISDATGTTIRYILTEKGLKSSNSDIIYGQKMYPVDFNQDGRDDYFNVYQEEDPVRYILYVS